MTWCNGNSDEQRTRSPTSNTNNMDDDHNNNSNCNSEATNIVAKEPEAISLIRICPSCGHEIKCKDKKAAIHELPGLPAGVKFDPTDQELLEHLEGKVRLDQHKHHRLIDEFIPILEGENGICYTHPEKLPGVSKNGQIRHFFHRPSKAYTTGNRKRRKVHTDEEGGETRWHKTGKTRPVHVRGELKGYKKILVLYTNYGKQKKPQKTNWVMHQYHLGNNEEEKDGELVVSKVFYQTQPRQCSSSSILKKPVTLSLNGETVGHRENESKSSNQLVDYYNSSFISFNHGSQNRASSHQSLVSHFARQDTSSYQ